MGSPTLAAAARPCRVWTLATGLARVDVSEVSRLYLDDLNLVCGTHIDGAVDLDLQSDGIGAIRTDGGLVAKHHEAISIGIIPPYPALAIESCLTGVAGVVIGAGGGV